MIGGALTACQQKTDEQGRARGAVEPQSALASQEPASATGWSWQEPHATVLPGGDLQWAPRPFVFSVGKAVRYIDFESGDDRNPGTSPGQPWKHHPWDANATEQARACTDADTYVFKRGVIYRGALVARQSGSRQQPIRLTSDPGWGSGEACLYGSERVSSSWNKLSGTPADAAIWYVDLPAGSTPYSVWEDGAGGIRRLTLARMPNWAFTNPDDLRSGWLTWEEVRVEPHPTHKKVCIGTITAPIDTLSADNLAGLTLWSDFPHLIGNPLPARIVGYDAARREITFVYPEFRAPPAKGGRFFIENALGFLDAPGEYFFDAAANRLYLRLEGDRDPNRTVIEVAARRSLISLHDAGHVDISGLTFRFTNAQDPFLPPWSSQYQPGGCVELGDNVRDIAVHHCRFEQVVLAVGLELTQDGSSAEAIEVRDNDIADAEMGGIHLSDGYTSRRRIQSALHSASVLRNRLTRVGLGLRPMNSHGVAIELWHVRRGEVAGNIVQDCGGQGVNVEAGKAGSTTDDDRSVPLVRVLVHHNKVVNSLHLLCDYGGIETWQCGPVYVFNNISGNPIGYRRPLPRHDPEISYTGKRFGFAYYLDGAFKNYLFNNIAWGKDNELGGDLCNSAGLMEVLGHNNVFFNNTFYKFGCGSRKQSAVDTQFAGGGRVPGRSFYLGNIWADMTDYFFNHDAWIPQKRDTAAAPIDFATMAFGGNLFYGQPRTFGTLEYKHESFASLADFAGGLSARRALLATVGVVAEENPLPGAPEHRFLPAANQPLPRRSRVFVPWGLSRVVGEWNFYSFAGSGKPVIFGENMNFSDEYTHRMMYRLVPPNDLQAVNVVAADFVSGPLENWIAGALRFNGRDSYCVLADREMKKDVTYEYEHKKKVNTRLYEGMRRETPDMGTNNFLIEMVIRVEAGKTGTVVAKESNGAGYRIRVNEQGMLAARMQSAGNSYEAVSTRKVATGQWVHALVEVDRATAGGLKVYLDGKEASTQAAGRWPESAASLANTGDFLVGKSPEGDFFSGALDFLRVSRGTLAEAHTTIEELYAWEFAGPFLRDFAGKAPENGLGNCGALER